MKFKYKKVKTDSKEALKLQQKSWKIILSDNFNGYILFEIKNKKGEKEKWKLIIIQKNLRIRKLKTESKNILRTLNQQFFGQTKF
jgi:hypothetical protein